MQSQLLEMPKSAPADAPLNGGRWTGQSAEVPASLEYSVILYSFKKKKKTQQNEALSHLNTGA